MQPLVQIVRDTRGCAAPSTADRPVGVAEQPSSSDLAGVQAVVGGLTQSTGASRAPGGTRPAGAVAPQVAKERMDLRRGAGRKPFPHSGADELMQPQGIIPGRVDERVRGQRLPREPVAGQLKCVGELPEDLIVEDPAWTGMAPRGSCAAWPETLGSLSR